MARGDCLGNHADTIAQLIHHSSLVHYPYDNLAKHFHPYDELVREVCNYVDELAQGRSLRILDAGCGTGNYNWELTRRGHRVVGVDSSPAMLIRAEHKRQSDSECPRFILHDLSNPLPFEDDSFDVVICIMVLYSLENPDYLVGELRRVTSSLGSLVTVTMQKNVDVLGPVAEAYREYGSVETARMTIALLGTMVFNLIIKARHKTGAYHTMNEHQIRSFLGGHSWTIKHTDTTYTCGTGVLAICDF
jgi:ubiquinone/menaquinone biosynthesis C-methylase UbiE